MVVKKMRWGSTRWLIWWSDNGDQNDGRGEGCCEVRCGDGGEGGAAGGEKHKYFPNNGYKINSEFSF